MGWVKRKWQSFKERLFHLSLKKALAAYIVLGTAATLAAMVIFSGLIQNLLYELEWKYLSFYEEELRAAENELYGLETYEEEFDQSEAYNAYVERTDEAYRNAYERMGNGDRMLKNILDFLESWGPVICIVAGVAGVCVLFYRNKLKRPLQILTDSAEKIAANDLDFRCEYSAKDEMGQLCAGFEKMRGSLKNNHQKMWDMMEELRRLNHAFAHDLRTPLTVLHGYIDFLEKYYPEGKVGEEKLMETLAMMDRQVLRLRRFGDTMRSVSSLEDRKVVKKRLTGVGIFESVKAMTEALDGTGGVHIWTERRIFPEQEFFLDEELFLETAENILSNGMRYARKWVQVILAETGGFLELYVKDDGPGFTEEGLHMAAKPYYKDKEETGKEHFGIGLYICHVLCEKHDGFLSIHNSVDGGAIISASFQAGEMKEKE